MKDGESVGVKDPEVIVHNIHLTFKIAHFSQPPNLAVKTANELAMGMLPPTNVRTKCEHFSKSSGDELRKRSTTWRRILCRVMLRIPGYAVLRNSVGRSSSSKSPAHSRAACDTMACAPRRILCRALRQSTSRCSYEWRPSTLHQQRRWKSTAAEDTDSADAAVLGEIQRLRHLRNVGVFAQ